MQDELIRVFDYTDQNDDIKSVVITGKGVPIVQELIWLMGPTLLIIQKKETGSLTMIILMEEG